MTLFGMSCPTKSLCVAAGDHNTIAWSTNPTGGASEWHIVDPAEGGISDEDHHRTGPASAYRQIGGVSCPSPNLCVAVTFDGYIYTSTNPTGEATAWNAADIDGEGRDTHLEGVSCPDPSFCVAVSGNRYTSGKVLTSTNPTGGSSAWQVAQLDESLDLRAVSCMSRSLCIAVGEDGRMVQSTNPTGGTTAWKEVGTPGGPGNLHGISCVLSELCVAGNSGGNLLTSTNPAAGLSSWAETNGGGSVQITGVSCPSPMKCAAVDNNGDVLTSSDPTGGAGAWSFSNVIPYVPPAQNMAPLNAIFSVSCPSSSLCALGATGGRIFSNADPFSATPTSSTNGKRVRRPKRPRTTLAAVDRFHNRTRHHWFKARFRFYANGRARGFICKRDRGPYKPCRSPVKYFVGVGKHIFRVRAIGLTGLKGPIALDRFTVILARR